MEKNKIIGPLPLSKKTHPLSILQVPTTQLANIKYRPYIVELAADVLGIINIRKWFVLRHVWLLFCTTRYLLLVLFVLYRSAPSFLFVKKKRCFGNMENGDKGTRQGPGCAFVVCIVAFLLVKDSATMTDNLNNFYQISIEKTRGRYKVGAAQVPTE